MNKLQINQLSDNEFQVGGIRTILTENNIIHIKAVGNLTDEMADLQKELNLKMFTMVEEKLNLLIDLNRCGKNSSKARSTWNELSENHRINKVAIFGLHPVARVIASFVIGFSIRKNQSFFKTEEEAIAWLAE